MTIAMGAIGNYPFALAAGLGINAIVAFSLTGQGLSPAGAMGVIVLGRHRRHGPGARRVPRGGDERRAARPSRRPSASASACSSCSSASPTAASSSRTLRRPPVTFHLPTTAADFVFWIGLILTIVLWVLKIRAALVISILVTTVIALIAGVTKSRPTSC